MWIDARRRQEADGGEASLQIADRLAAITAPQWEVTRNSSSSWSS